MAQNFRLLAPAVGRSDMHAPVCGSVCVDSDVDE